jgi:hypothetical protein
MTRETFRTGLALVAALAFAALVYWPGIGGSFIYDDLPFIANNPGVHVAQGSFDAWMRAMLSFPEAHQGRWLGMLSFALNYRFAGLAIVPYKLTNLAIHLVNGVLVYAMLRRLFALAARGDKDGTIATTHAHWLALGIAAAWLVLPINLTSVLYVSQRLESLCETFVLIGLAGYLGARLRHRESGGSAWPMALWIVAATAVGCAVKESAVLLPLYALIADSVLTGLRDAQGRIDRFLARMYAIILGIPFVVGTAWLMFWISGPTTYSMNVGTGERLLTEARVLVDYLQWTLWPRLDQFALIHDDYLPSHGLFDPVSTALCLATLVGLGGLAWYVRRRVPLACLGIAWFFAAHVLTATIIPIDLVFEHRNYFASIGVLLAVAAFAMAIPAVGRLRTLALVTGILVALHAAQVAERRAWEWGDAWRYVASEAAHRPLSSDAQYAFAVAMSQGLGGTHATQDQVDAVLVDAARLPGASIAPEVTLIILREHAGQPADPAWWRSLIDKLRARPPSTTDINALIGLLQCHHEGRCPDTAPLLGATLAALGHGAPSAPLLTAYAGFAIHDLHDPAIAERALRDAMAARPDVYSYRADLIELLRAEHRVPEADAEMAALRAANRFGELDATIANLDAPETGTSTRP